MSICFICEQSISEDEKPVGARGRLTLLTASVTRGHSDHEKLLLCDETVRAANKGIYKGVCNNLINKYFYIYKNGIVEKLKD